MHQWIDDADETCAGPVMDADRKQADEKGGADLGLDEYAGQKLVVMKAGGAGDEAEDVHDEQPEQAGVAGHRNEAGQNEYAGWGVAFDQSGE